VRLALRLLAAVGIFFVIQAAAFAIAQATVMAELGDLRAEAERLENGYAWESHFAAKRALYREQGKELDRQLAQMRARLPDRMDVSFTALKHAASVRGLRAEVQPDANEVPREFYAELPARLSVTGPVHAVGAFMEDLGQLPGSVALAPFALERAPGGQVKLTGTVRTFRYLSDAEVAAQRKAAAAQRKRP
jgi:type IV pilus assembly protein PilO